MRKLKFLGIAVALVLIAALLGAYGCLRGSLPRLDGELRQAALSAPVRITRDARGVPTIEAAKRADLAYGTGFLHAQDRFFEMDLSRRLAAGELSELFGAVALDQDRKARLFRFRNVARQVFEQAPPDQRAVMEAYSRGVNAGLAALRARPWEYWLLGQKPVTWQAEDGILVTYAMWWDLQASGLPRGILRQQINARLHGPSCADGWKCALRFFYPFGTRWDAPVIADAAVQPEAPIPGPEVIDVRAGAQLPPPTNPVTVPVVGSNNWAVGGALTATGAALVANDMHLGQRVPTIWYHARLRIRGATPAQDLDLNGVTLPGAPLLVAGSNGHVAWGFTNSYGNWLDVEPVECSSVAPGEMSTPAGKVALAVVQESIKVKGAAAVTLDVQSGPAGVLLRTDAATHTCWFGSWLAQQPAATNMNLMLMEQVSSVAQAIELAPQIGIPHQNLMVGDREGHIGWTIAGRIPEGTGPDRSRSVAAWTTAADHPHLIDPPQARLWSANARVAADPAQLAHIAGNLVTLGSEYDVGARAGQIRDDLLALKGNLKPADMLRIQLDDRALFLAPWQVLALSVLDEQELAGHPRRAEFRRLVAGWDARASVDSVGYRLVRAFHERTRQAVWDMLLTGLGIPPEKENYAPEQFEGSLWRILTEQPLHLLSANYPGWTEFLKAQMNATIDDLDARCPQVAECTWGKRNQVRIRHPLSGALPASASAFLDMPTLELPGDEDMPRVQGRDFGASERFAVSPGHEDQAYLDLPGGQSGHPLSPYYRAGFLEWAHGVPLPLLPGPTQHTLTLQPN
jgi:penicillin G amidase